MDPPTPFEILAANEYTHVQENGYRVGAVDKSTALAALSRMSHDHANRVEGLRDLCARQAEDAGLWVEAETAPEAYIQKALRKLHAAIEDISS